ncbi:MAG: hypothetical protein FWG38_04640 [Defluviitaleaceae bacterium]|nr:hypothetical protein [Defluviitaleaceae bacterium]
MVGITDGPHSALAWEFVQFLIPAFTVAEGIPPWRMDAPNPAVSMFTPIAPNLFYSHYTTVLQIYQEMWPARPMGFPERQDAALDRLLAYSHMPMAPNPWVPIVLLRPSFDSLMHGLLSPQEAAQQMHNTVSLWLIE